MRCNINNTEAVPHRRCINTAPVSSHALEALEKMLNYLFYQDGKQNFTQFKKDLHPVPKRGRIQCFLIMADKHIPPAKHFVFPGLRFFRCTLHDYTSEKFI